MDRIQMKEKLKTMLTPRRYQHSIGVMNTARELARRFGADEGKAEIAGLLHDCAKDIDKSKMVDMCDELGVELDDLKKEQRALIHPDLGAKLVQTEFDITDPEIISAIKHHTLGRPDMTKLEKILYLADYIEPNREEMEGLAELRALCREDLDRAMLFATDMTISYVLSKKKVLHKQSLATREYFRGLVEKSSCKGKVTT